MMLQRADMEGRPVDPALLNYAKNPLTEYQVARGIRDILCGPYEVGVMIELDGLPDHEYRMCEPLDHVNEHLPGLLADLLETASDRELKSEATTFIYEGSCAERSWGLGTHRGLPKLRTSGQSARKPRDTP